MAKARPDTEQTAWKDTDLPKPEWGVKRTCVNNECNVRFYDMMNSDPTCPACDTSYDPSAKGRRGRSAPEPRRTKPQTERTEIENDGDQIEMESELDEDIDDLDNDDNDVVENVANLEESC